MRTRVATFTRSGMTLALLVASGIGSAGEASAKGGYSVGQFAYHRLNSAHEYLAEGKTELARNVLHKMGAELRLNAHEQALMWQTHGHIYATEERYDEAAKAFEKSLAANGLPERTELDTRYNLGQLYMATERFAKAVTTLEAWLKKAKNPSGDAHFLVAAAYSQTKRYEPALKHIRAAIAKNDDPPESWLQLMLFLHVERKDLPAATDVLKRLVTRYPRKDYWTQLASVYSERNDNRHALAVMELAYEQGLLTEEADLLQLASLFAHQEVPLKAAEVLKQGLHKGVIRAKPNTWRFLGDVLATARLFDEATEALRKAAEVAEDGELYVRMAQLQLREERWTAAIDLLEEALRKGGLRDPGTAYLLLGIANRSAGRTTAARKAFRAASEFENTQKAAQEWLNLLDAASTRKRSTATH